MDLTVRLPLGPVRRRGIYLTEYGNTCYVNGPYAKTAWDIDAAERIPIEMVGSFIRTLQKGEHIDTSN
jgi:hypothetical protein